MRAQFSNYSIDKFNKDLNQMLDGKLVNFFKLFVMKEPDTYCEKDNKREVFTGCSNRRNKGKEIKI